ncbi:MAG: hypothetical protein ABMA64_01545 [Myxococcota bacterium]
MIGWMWLGCAGQPIATDTGCAESFDDHAASVLITYCDACHAERAADRHGAPASVTFDTADQAADWADRIAARVDAGDMPPGGGVTEQDVASLDVWLECLAR